MDSICSAPCRPQASAGSALCHRQLFQKDDAGEGGGSSVSLFSVFPCAILNTALLNLETICISITSMKTSDNIRKIPSNVLHDY